MEELRTIRFRCAGNSLYMLLKMTGRDVSLNEIDRLAPITERGVSMLTLRDAARRLGLPCEVRYLADMRDLQHCPMPVIAYFSPSQYGLPTGHFVVVVDVVSEGTRRGVWFIDTTVGKLVRYRWERFPAYWNGYIVKPSRPLLSTEKVMLTASGGFGSLVGLIWWRRA